MEYMIMALVGLGLSIFGYVRSEQMNKENIELSKQMYEQGRKDAKLDYEKATKDTQNSQAEYDRKTRREMINARTEHFGLIRSRRK